MVKDVRVLVVDDTPETLLTTSRVVSKAGYSVIEASTGRECMDQVRLHKPDLVLLDVVLPDADGRELVREIKSHPGTENTFVVLVSGKMITSEDRTMGLSLGADGYIARPVSNRELEAQVHAFVRIKNTEKQLYDLTLELAEANRSLQEEIIERRKVQEELQRSETLLRIAGDLARLGGWSVNLEENRVIWSDQVAAIHDMPAGYSPTVDEGISFYTPEFQDRIKEVFSACAEHGTPYDEEMKIITARGRKVWIRTMGVAEKDDSGKVLKVHGGFQDISEFKQAQEEREKLQAQLVQAQKMESVGMLAGGIAHDFNNLLHAMGGSLQLLDMKIPDDHPGKKRVQTIQKAIDRAADLVRQMLLFSRKAETRRTDMDLNQEIGESIKMLQRSIPKMVKIEFYPDSDLWPIKADPVQVEQVLFNLGTNAADAMPQGGRLIIEANNLKLGKDNYMSLAPGPYVLMSVTDTGCGMDQETRTKVFDPFFTTKEVGKGTGLGLASVYGTVKSHMGHINCYSEPGKGTTFKIYWPASSTLETGPDVFKSSVETVLEHKKETILVVDDDKDIRDLTVDVLRSYDYQVLAADGGEQALEIYSVEKEFIDLVLLDLNMPGMGGHKCLVELVGINPGIRVLITSGYSANGQVRETLEQGAAGFIGKPYQVHELLTRVREVLDKDKN